jgi:predicted SAM-dependent methyltransferase
MKTLIRAHLRRLLNECSDFLHTLYGESFRAARTRAQLRGRSGLRLNIGAGRLAREGYVNLDRFPASADVLYWDFRNPLPVETGSATHIHCEHFIEHLEHPEALALLQEFGRVLAPGGTLRLICPDAGLYLRAYVNGDRAFFSSLERLGGAMQPMTQPIEVINQMFRMGGSHRYAWDQASLRAALETAGFHDIRDSSLGETSLGGDMDGTDDWRRIESLYLWARRSA